MRYRVVFAPEALAQLEADVVSIVGVYYGGQDYERVLRLEDDAVDLYLLGSNDHQFMAIYQDAIAEVANAL